MGKPKFSRKKYETPSHPWQEDRIKSENELITKFGLKNKREIWKAETRLRKYRGQARELLAKIETGDVQSKKESDQLLMHLNRLNILPVSSTLDDVLALETESILSRRLQTLTYLKGFAGTPKQARQLISHGHISIKGRKVTVPSYMVTKEEEGEIGYIADSPLSDAMHPARPKADFKSSIPISRPEKAKEDKTVEQKEEKPAEQPKTEEKPVEVIHPVEETKTEDKPSETEAPVQEHKEEPTKEPEIKKEASVEQTSVENNKPEEQKEENEKKEKKDENKGGNE